MKRQPETPANMPATKDLVVRTVDGHRTPWDSSRYEFAFGEYGELKIMLIVGSTIPVAVYAAGQWISAVNGGLS